MPRFRVLGNHDLHLLSLAEGYGRMHKSDTLDAVLAAPDRDELMHWLRHQRLAWREDNFLMVHAGVLPGWSVEDTMRYAHEAEAGVARPGLPGIFRAHVWQHPDAVG